MDLDHRRDDERTHGCNHVSDDHRASSLSLDVHAERQSQRPPLSWSSASTQQSSRARRLTTGAAESSISSPCPGSSSSLSTREDGDYSSERPCFVHNGWPPPPPPPPRLAPPTPPTRSSSSWTLPHRYYFTGASTVPSPAAAPVPHQQRHTPVRKRKSDVTHSRMMPSPLLPLANNKGSVRPAQHHSISALLHHASGRTRGGGGASSVHSSNGSVGTTSFVFSRSCLSFQPPLLASRFRMFKKANLFRLVVGLAMARFAWALYWMHVAAFSSTTTTTLPWTGERDAPASGSAASLSSWKIGPSVALSASSDRKKPIASSSSSFLNDSSRRIISVQEPSRNQKNLSHGSVIQGISASARGNKGESAVLVVEEETRSRTNEERLTIMTSTTWAQRRQRTTPLAYRLAKPPGAKDAELFNIDAAFRYDQSADAQTRSLPGPVQPESSTTDKTQHSQRQMKTLCRDSGISGSSSVLVMGLNGLSTAFLIVAARHCGLRNVLLVDPVMPNLRKERLRTLSLHLRALQKTELKLNLDFRVPSDGGMLLRKEWFAHGPRSALTHVVSFPSPVGYSEGLYDLSVLSTIMNESSYMMYQMHQPLLSWNQALLHVTSQLASQRGSKKQSSASLRMLHVSVTGAGTESNDIGRSQPQQQRLQSHLAQILSKAHLESLSKVLEISSELSISHLTIPVDRIVGPFCSEDSLVSQTDSRQRTMYVTQAIVAVFQALCVTRSLNKKSSVRAAETVSRDSSVQLWNASVGADATILYDDWRDAVEKAKTARSDAKNVNDLLSMMADHSIRWKTPTVLLDDVRTRIWSTKNITASLAVPTSLVPTLSMVLSDDLLDHMRIPFPCSSSCRSNPGGNFGSSCQPSVWESLLPISRKATAGCIYVVYVVVLDKDLDEMPEPNSGSDKSLCRVAIVDASSPLVKEKVKSKMANSPDHGTFDSWNGNVEASHWTLLWLNATKELSLGDEALLKIDPSRMFADSVKRVLYAEYFDYVKPSDEVLARVIHNVDRRGLPRRRTVEVRHGVSGIRRFVFLEPEPPKKAILFAAEPIVMPKNLNDFVRRAGSAFNFPGPQLRFYDQLAHLIQVNNMRPESEVRSTLYPDFPIEWVSTSALVHDLVSQPAQDLRCRWYDEYLYWGGNRNAEEFTLSVLLATMRIAGVLGLPVSATVDQPDQDVSWYPILDAADGSRETVGRNDMKQEIFVRVMRHRRNK